MRLINKSNIADKDIQRMFDFCAEPLGLRAMTVKVYPTKFINGYFGFSLPWKSEISIAVGGKEYPYFDERPEKTIVNSDDRWMWSEEEHKYIVKPGYVDKYREAPHTSFVYLNVYEWTIHIMAHELRHQWQRKIRPMKDFTFTVRHLGKKSRFRRERDADSFAKSMVRKWRKLHAVDIYPEQPDQMQSKNKDKVVP